MSEELEEKYLVVKYSDIDNYLDVYERSALWNMLNKIDSFRAQHSKAPWKGICIRDTWPEYEEVKAKLLERINNEN